MVKNWLVNIIKVGIVGNIFTIVTCVKIFIRIIMMITIN